jgi:low affinity Fe/Cu permease
MNKIAQTKGDGSMVDRFGRFAASASYWLGSKWAFIVAGTIVLVWAITGPVFRYSDTWQLVINTGTTIVTFLMVFLIQNTQNRDARAINLKLDELIRAIDKARDQMMNIEKLSDAQLDVIEDQFDQMPPVPSHGQVREKVDQTIVD